MPPLLAVSFYLHLSPPLEGWNHCQALRLAPCLLFPAQFGLGRGEGGSPSFPCCPLLHTPSLIVPPPKALHHPPHVLAEAFSYYFWWLLELPFLSPYLSPSLSLRG